MHLLLGILALAAAGAFVVWILSNQKLRWIFAVIGFLAFCGWFLAKCGHAHAAEPPRAVFGLVDGPFDLPVPPLEDPPDSFRLP